MSFKCKIGLHSWDGCKCSECGKEQHDWSNDCEKCAKCGQQRVNQHERSKECEKCSKCGKIGPHEWDGCKCSTCGELRDEQHDWSKNCEICSTCFSVRSVHHCWNKDLICTICGKKFNYKSLYLVANGQGSEDYEDWNKIQRKNSKAFFVRAINETPVQPEILSAFAYYVFYNLGKIGLTSKDELNLLTDIYKVKTNDPFILGAIGMMLSNDGMFNESLVFLNKNKLNSNTPSLFIPSFLNRRARCYKELKKPEDAIQCYQELLKLKPNWLVAYKNIALCYKELSIAKNMQEYDAKFIELENKRNELYKAEHLSNFDLSWEDYKAAKNKFDIQISTNIASDFENSKQKEAFDLHQDNSNLMISLSFIYERFNMIGEAINAAKLAVEAEEPLYIIDNSNTLSRLFDLFIKNGDFKNAIEVANTVTFKHTLGWGHMYSSISQCYSELGFQELANVYQECKDNQLSATHGLI